MSNNGDKNRGSMDGVMSKGYGTIPKLVMQHEDLSIEAKAIYAYLASFAGAGDTAYPSVSIMCKHLGISKDRFYRHRKSLLELDFIRITQHQNEGGWSNNLYTVVSMPHPQNTYTRNKDTQNKDTQNKDTQNKDTINNSSINNSINNNSINKESSPAKAERIPYQEIIEYLNKQADRNFNHKASSNQDLIKARWNEGYTLDDFKQAIDNKVAHANDPNHFFNEQYLRPSTLFRKSNFDEYVNAVVKSKKTKVSNDDNVNFNELSELLGGANE
ncbi:MAG: conserved phage C-terminal domain-containing protein [Tetragenococcus koreensis]|nr:conserved phage C-terminal domain-containing protein [Tetragenococcus koreensis]